MAAPIRNFSRRIYLRFLGKRGSFVQLSQSNEYAKRCMCSSSSSPSEKQTSLNNRIREFEISTEEFKYVERILPKKVVPEPPDHESYPTPSGWIPQKEEAKNLPYFVRRTKNHMMPVYLEKKAGGSQLITRISKIDGDIWAFKADIKQYLQEQLQKEVKTQVHEVCRFVRVKGHHIPQITKFLLDKGF